ncbi:MAG: DEAD/DEAH box helicase, partial [Chloroflexi bacterium]|nr:DEAD/DEAH box helicase [Chloroflexota bacterium]
MTTVAAPLMDALRAAAAAQGGDATWLSVPARPARFADWPTAVDARIREALRGGGIARLYTHQAEAVAHALARRDQVVVTPTASGKTLCYTVPVLQALLDDPNARALYLFPTKALAQDQLHELQGLVEAAGLDVGAFTYDGDTAPAARRAVRTAGHVVITNPDMLHTGILPHHTKWVRLFEQLRYIVVDELHIYRGVFGSHVANVLWRLLRVCRFYGSDPVFICCSATIANPRELASALTGRTPALVADNGAPRGERHVLLYNPPVVQPALGIRRGVVRSATALASALQAAGAQTLVFARSRTDVEVLTQYLRAAPGGRARLPGHDQWVRGYRSGYLPRERRAIEAGLRDASVRTVVATNALELGIDIGGLDATVLAGYPGSVASFWQQVGRAGRSEAPSVAVYVAGSGALDQYIVTHPEFLDGERVEAVLIDPENLLVAADHVRCAVFELPLDDEERAQLGASAPVVLDELEAHGLVHRTGGRTYWTSEAYPAHEVSLRRGDEQNVVIIEQTTPPVVIGEVDRASAMTLLHDEAIYLHDGRQYHVDRLDWEELKAYVRAVNVDYYTDAHLAVDLRVLARTELCGEPAPSGCGDVAVTYLATIFKKIKLHTHENIGWGTIRLPQDDVHSTAFWLALPDDAIAGWPAADIESALVALGQLLAHCAPLLVLCAAGDLQLATQLRSPHTLRPTVFLWESVPGGVGLAEQLCRERARLLMLARATVAGCACPRGCPA